jgi:hypothetical protein
MSGPDVFVVDSRLLQKVMAEFDGENTIGFLLTGSHARGDATLHSDIDILRFTAEVPPEKIDREKVVFREGNLVSISTTTVESKLNDIMKPEMAGWVVPGLRQGRILLDRTGAVSSLKKAAHDFVWEPLQAAADRYAGHELAGLAEEVNKIVSALVARKVETVFYPLMGLVLGLTKAVCVKYGVMVASENTYFRQVRDATGVGSSWTIDHREACGLAESSRIEARAAAALRLYAGTAQLIGPLVERDEQEVVDQTLKLVERSLSEWKY